MPLKRATRSEKLDLRLTPDAKNALKAAAAITHRSGSESVLESALARANETLAERQTVGMVIVPPVGSDLTRLKYG